LTSGGTTTLPMPMPASATAEPASNMPTPPALARSSRPAVASSMVSTAVRSSPIRRIRRGVPRANAANAAVGIMPSTPVMVLPKSNRWPRRSSSGVSEVTALRRLAATRMMAAKASRRPLNSEGRGAVDAGLDIAWLRRGQDATARSAE